jgi:hypothetical protein
VRNNPDIVALAILALLLVSGADRRVAGLIGAAAERPVPPRVVIVDGPLIFR